MSTTIFRIYVFAVARFPPVYGTNPSVSRKYTYIRETGLKEKIKRIGRNCNLCSNIFFIAMVYNIVIKTARDLFIEFKNRDRCLNPIILEEYLMCFESHQYQFSFIYLNRSVCGKNVCELAIE